MSSRLDKGSPLPNALYDRLRRTGNMVFKIPDGGKADVLLGGDVVLKMNFKDQMVTKSYQQIPCSAAFVTPSFKIVVCNDITIGNY